MNTSQLICISSLFVSLTNTGCATTKREQLEAKFAELDTDRNDQLSYQEFLKTRIAQRSDDPKAAFAATDTNRDGQLSKREIIARFKERKQ
jgi:Ca2+-binding EF-hand superfamily protein